MAQKKQSLVEAAADIFLGNIATKRASGEPFGNGTTLHRDGIAIDKLELGPQHVRGDTPFVDFTKGVPTATPPGATPPVGAAPRPKLPTQPQQHDGAGDNTDPQEKTPEGNSDNDLIRDRKSNVTPHIQPGQGNVQPSWGRNESIVVSTEDLEALLDEAKSWKDEDGDARKAKVKSWKDTRKQNMRAAKKAEKKSIKEELMPFVTDKMDVSEDVDAILSGETLTPEFKEKATLIYETAVMAKVSEITEVLETVYTESLDAAVDQIASDLETKVDEYLTYMVEEWIKENEIAIEKGLRGEIVEDFISGLRNLFMEHYIDIPEEKVDVVTELSEKVAKLEEALNTQITKNVELSQTIGESKKHEAINALCEGLTKTQVDKIRSLAESVDYTTDEEFKSKIVTLKESYFPNKVKVPGLDNLNSDSLIVEDENKTHLDPLMQSLVNTLSRTVK